MTVRRLTILGLLVPVVLVVAAPGASADPGRATFANGLYVDLAGTMRTLFAEGHAIPAPSPLDNTKVSFTLDLDVPIRIGDRDVSPGRPQFVAFIDPEKAWTLAKKGEARRGNARLTLTMTEDAPVERDFSVRFVRTSDPRALEMLVAWGPRRGRISVLIDPGSAPTPVAAAQIDEARLGKERDRMILAVGDVVAASRSRGRWILALSALRDAAVPAAGPQTILLKDVTSKVLESSFRLTIQGQTCGSDHDDIGRFRDRLQSGPFGKLLPEITVATGDPIKNVDGDIEAHTFTINADATLDGWVPRREAVEASQGWKVRDETAYLDLWLGGYVGPSYGVSNIRSKLQEILELRSSTYVMAKVDPCPARTKPGEVLTRFCVEMELQGPYDGILKFLSGIQSWRAPAWCTVKSIREGDGIAVAAVEFEFLSYEPLAKRDAAVWASLRVDMGDAAFIAAATEYRSRLPAVVDHEPYPGRKGAGDPFALPKPAAEETAKDEED